MMKTTLPIWCSVLLIAGVAWGQDSMTLEKFNTLVASPGDINALRPELASPPFWKAARCSMVITPRDGQVFSEESVQTSRTIGGKYVVFSMHSQEIDRGWDAEISEPVRSVEEGRSEALAYEEVIARVDRRIGS